MPIFKLKLQSTYYRTGFFNIGVEHSRFVRPDDGPITILIGDDGLRIEAQVNRRANGNGTPRIMGGTPLRDWFQRNRREFDVIEINLSGPDLMIIGSFGAEIPSPPKPAPIRESDMNETLSIPAARVKQGALTLYTTAIKVRDLVSPGFYSVETLDPENSNDKGFQRLLNHARAKKLADYIVKGQDSQDAFLPTSVFLATDRTIPFNETRNTIDFNVGTVGPFSVVDGQHRLEGLKMAAEKDPRVLDFDVPVNIAIDLPKIAQMCHFLIVNTTQKSVDKSVEQRIIARLSEALDIEELPSLPKWILNTVERGEVDKAVKYVDFLNETQESPWFHKVEMANSDTEGATINQRSFVKAIVKYVLTANNPISVIFKDFNKEKKVFLNYWIAIARILDDGSPSVLYKYNGVELFCKFSIPFFMKLQNNGSFTVTSMEALLRSCFDSLEGINSGLGHPAWWAKGGQAGGLNAGAINKISQEMAAALHQASTAPTMEL